MAHFEAFLLILLGELVMVVVQPLGRSVNNLDRIVGGLQGIGSKCFGVPLSD